MTLRRGSTDAVGPQQRLDLGGAICQAPLPAG